MYLSTEGSMKVHKLIEGSTHVSTDQVTFHWSWIFLNNGKVLGTDTEAGKIANACSQLLLWMFLSNHTYIFSISSVTNQT